MRVLQYLHWRNLIGLFLILTYIYRATAAICGGDLQRKSGSFYSPHQIAEKLYPNNTLCIWTITVPNDSVIHFRFTFFDLEESIGCDHDYVELYDVEGLNKSLIVKSCGHQIPDTVVTKGNQLQVVFSTDSSITFSGFHAIYNTEFYTSCGSHLNTPSGVFTSPNYNATYPQFAFCKWTITAPADTVVSLRFTSINVEMDQTDEYCHRDQIEVYDGNSSNHSLISRLCGYKIPPPIVSKGNQMFILFKSDESVSDSGFRAVYNTQSCGSHFTETSGVITSPSYPNVYPESTNCNWTITVSEGSVISLSFPSFGVEPDKDCKYDHVEIYDGDSSNSDSLIARLCGQQIPSPLLSKGNQMYIVFASDRSKGYPGFKAVYHTIAKTTNLPYQQSNHSSLWTTLNFMKDTVEPNQYTTPYVNTLKADVMTTTTHKKSTTTRRPIIILPICGGNFQDKSGFFYSPSPSAKQIYPNNVLCNWTITVPNNSVIHFRFTYFDLEESIGCDHDYVELYDVDRLNKSLIAKLCGHQIPDTVVTKGNQLQVVFSTDSSVTFSGFHAIYNTEFFTACGADLNKPMGIVTSPNYNASYPNFAFCNWTITAPEGTVVSLGFTNLDVETDQADAYCHNDQIELYDGSSSKDRLITRLCGFKIPPLFVTTGNKMFILFKTDQFVSKSGFRAVYKTQACGSHLTTASGVLTSPGYPHIYPDYTFCNWTVTVPKDSLISLRFTTFSLAPDRDCKYDQLEVYEGNSSDHSLIVRLCGQQIPPPYVSKGNEIYISFKTARNRGYQGFEAVYHSISNSTNNTNHQSTNSPWYTTRPYISTIPPHQETTLISKPSTSFKIGHHHVVISPQSFHSDTRSHFSVNCSVDNLERDVENVVSLVLSRNSSLSNYTEETVASITSYHPDTPTLTIKAADATVEGSLDNDHGNYYLTVKWSFPTLAEEAVYVCEANALNKRGRPVSSTVYASSSVNQNVSGNMTYAELMHSLGVLQNENARLTQAYLNLKMANKELLSYNFITPFDDGNGTRYFLSRFQPLDAQHANKMCSQLLNGTLVEIDSVAEYSFLQQYLAVNLGSDEMVLTGATDEAQYGIWTNLLSQARVPVLDWGAAQPDEDHERHCLALWRTNLGVKMANTSCSSDFKKCATHFLCEVQG